jgi:hypothetical protein
MVNAIWERTEPAPEPAVVPAPKDKQSCPPFIIFSKDQRPEIKLEHPDRAFVQVTKRLRDLWKSMSDVDKLAFKNQTQREWDFQRDHPGERCRGILQL